MGVYLSKPIKDKVSNDCENSRLKCGASSMQGWRVAQEDAHNCCLDFDSDCSLFAVYDGHGGHDVAEYTASHLPDHIRNNEFFKKKDYEKALVDSFLGFDATLKMEGVIAELKRIAAKGKEKSHDDSAVDNEEDSDEGDNVEKLKEEAVMPISDVMAQYAGLARTPALRRLAGEANTPISPVLKAKSSKSDSPVVSDNEVSSSNDSSDRLVNGLKDVAERNGDIQEGECLGSGAKTKTVGKDEVPSSSQHNGEVASSGGGGDDPVEGGSRSGESSTGERVAKKKAAASMFNTLLAQPDTSEDDTDSENDESFHVAENIVSSDEDENGNEEEDDAGEEAEDEEEEEDEDDEEEEEDEEEDMGEGFELKDLDEVPGRDSGCTAVVALVAEGALYVANAGDSRAVLCRKGEAIDLSLDHKPEDGPEMERIIAAGGRVTSDGRVNGGLNLSRAFGDHTYKQVSSMSPTEQMIIALPDVKKEIIDPLVDEFVVLACDGIWNSMTSQEVVDFVRPLLHRGDKLSSICEMLFDRCLAPDTLGDGTGCDNMTCVIVQFLNDNQEQENGNTNTNKRSGSPVKGNDSKKPKVNSS